ERLTAILIAFGSVGRRTIERLKSSQNPAVRRTAIYLMREFGGSDALPDLTELLDDSEQQVQREAVRAILNVGTDAAYRILEQALGSGTARSREAIMQSIGLVRDERAAPLFAYIPGHIRESLSGAFQLLHSLQPAVVIGLVGEEVIVDDMPMARADTLGPLVRRLQQSGVDRITVDRGVTAGEIATFVSAVTTIDARNGDGAEAFPPMAHIRVGRVTVEQRVESSLTDMATIKRLSSDAVTVASDVWDSAQSEGRPDATVARTMIDGLA